MALIITTWLWGSKYGVSDVAKLAAGVRRNLKEPYRFLCLTDDMGRELIEGVDYRPIPDLELTKVAGCFARLRMFDPYWQFIREIKRGDRIVCMDLDSVVTGDLGPVFDRSEPFVILHGANAKNPCPYNGSLWLLRAGYRPDVWETFSVDAARVAPFYSFPDDQGWMANKIPDAAGWKAGAESGVFAFQKPGWPKGEALPSGARLVVFPGWRDPSKFTHLDWVSRHWSS